MQSYVSEETNHKCLPTKDQRKYKFKTSHNKVLRNFCRSLGTVKSKTFQWAIAQMGETRFCVCVCTVDENLGRRLMAVSNSGRWC